MRLPVKFSLGLCLGAMVAAPAPASADPDVVVTIKPIHGLVARVMEGVGEPRVLIGGSASPHTFSMKPSDARALNKANVFFRVSERIEPFTGKITESLPKSVRVVTLAEAPGVELLNARTSGTFEAHAHDDDDDHEGEQHAGEKEAGHDEHAHEKEARDHHIWLDPKNAKAIVAEIARVMTEASPEDAERIKANASRLEADIDALSAELGKDLAAARGKPFVVFHDAYQYFERRFGLEAVGSITVSPDVQPSAKRLIEIRNKIKTLSAVCVFAEPQFKPKLVAAVTEGTSARSGTLDPEGQTIQAGPDAYFTLMRGLSEGLKSCLNQSS